MNWLGEIIQKNVEPNDTVLDLGCGIMQATKGLVCKSILGVDLFARYLEELKYEYQTIQLSVTETCAFLDKSYDIVLCTDVVEHLEKNDALKVIDECIRICRKTAIVYTPRVFQENYQPNDGAWGLGENVYQLHRCVITKEELETAGYKVTIPAVAEQIKCNLAIYNVNGIAWVRL
jgi:2-polyprenyl-3-methyl-5-hydroxy-6-metoxy-1,4-benzoquinol methylase